MFRLVTGATEVTRVFIKQSPKIEVKKLSTLTYRNWKGKIKKIPYKSSMNFLGTLSVNHTPFLERKKSNPLSDISLALITKIITLP